MCQTLLGTGEIVMNKKDNMELICYRARHTKTK